MATPSTRQAIVQAILKRRSSESFQREKKSMKGYVPSYLEGDEKCVVCGDKATGYHYKCITCEGCKGFFRRTVQKNLEGSYQCKHSSACDINKVTRNQCQLCRYNKCILVGMAKDLVLDEEKRLAKRKLIEQNRELRRHKELSQMMAQCGWRIERPTDNERRLIHDVTQAFFQANDIQNTAIASTANGTAIAERFSGALTAAITNVVDFAKRIPLFVNHVSTEDQVLILKVCCMEVITLRCVTSYKSSTKQVTLFPTVDVTREQLRFTRLEPFSESLFALAEHLHSMELTPVEVALLQATLIFSGDRPGICERVRLDRAQDTILRAFEHHLNEVWPHDPKYCPSLLMKLTDVRTVSACLADTLMSMRMDDPQELGRLFCHVGPVPALKSLPLHHPSINHPQRLQVRTLSESTPNRNSQGLHHAVMKSFSSPHLNGVDMNHSPLHAMQNPGDVFPFVPINGKTNIEDYLRHKPPSLIAVENNHFQHSNEHSCTAIPAAHRLTAEINSKSNKDGLFYSKSRNGVGLSAGNGVTYMPQSPEYVKYETYKNSHNKVFERMTKTLRTSSSLSDDTNRISRSHSITPVHLSSPHSHSVPSSPCKNGEGSRPVFCPTERNFVPIATRQTANSHIVTLSPNTGMRNSIAPHHELKRIRSIDFLAMEQSNGMKNGTHVTNGTTNGTPNGLPLLLNGVHGFPSVGEGILAASHPTNGNSQHNGNESRAVSIATTLSKASSPVKNGIPKSIASPTSNRNGCKPSNGIKDIASIEIAVDECARRHAAKKRPHDSPLLTSNKIKCMGPKVMTQTVINDIRMGVKNSNLTNMLTDLYKSTRLLVNSGMTVRIDENHRGTLPRNRPKSC